MSDDSLKKAININGIPENAWSAIQAAMRGQPVLTLPSEFDLFDPISGEVPYELRNIARRARMLLEEADRDQILAAVTFAELVTTAPLVDLEHPNLDLEDAEKAACSGDLDQLRPTTLFRRIPLVDETRMKPSELSWSVVFASLALAYVARSVNSGQSWNRGY